MQKLKIEKFIEKIITEEITTTAPIYKLLKTLIGRSVPITIERIVQRKFDAIDAISKLSWAELSIQEPVLSDDQFLLIIGNKISIEDW